MFRNTTHSYLLRISGALIALTLLFSACSPLAQPPAEPTVTQPAAVEPTPAPTDTTAPTQAPTDETQSIGPAYKVDLNGVAEEVTAQVVEAVAAGDDVMPTDVMPQYTLLSLQDYPITKHVKTPQIYMIQVKDLEVNETAAKMAEDLKALLQTQQVGDQLPYLPLQISVKQALHPQVKFLDFQNGKGVRFLTEWHNGLAPIDNRGLVYTFQGLTNDGKYYVAAVLPVNNEGLPADEADTAHLPANYQSDYTNYLSATTSMLEKSADSAYTPDLSKLDAMMQSMVTQ